MIISIIGRPVIKTGKSNMIFQNQPVHYHIIFYFSKI